MFGRKITLNRIRDSITIREGKDELHLYVDCEPNQMIRRIQAADRDLQRIDEKTSDEDRKSVSLALAKAIFGEEQAIKLLDFYHGDYGCVVTICGMYFGDAKHGLGKKITKAQKRRK